MSVPVHPIHAGSRMNIPMLAGSAGAIGAAILIAVARATGWWVFVVFLLAEIAVYLTFSALVQRRRRDLALLRCFGASRGQVFTGVLTEAACVGFFGTLLGFGAAVVVVDVSGLGIVLFATAIGVGGATVAALIPAFRASKVPPARPPGATCG